jgi:tRNA G18 (ribose-2'-O)-methylase SpoU
MQEETVYGIHPVLEVLQAERRQVEKVLVASRRPGSGVHRITALSAQRGIPVSRV